jgi:hypothetical protein
MMREKYDWRGGTELFPRQVKMAVGLVAVAAATVGWLAWLVLRCAAAGLAVLFRRPRA